MSFDAVSLTEKAGGHAGRGRAVAAGRADPAGARRCPRNLVGRGGRLVVRVAGGSLEARRPGGKAATRTLFEREGEDVYRTASGREHGELLRIVRTRTASP